LTPFGTSSPNLIQNPNLQDISSNLFSKNYRFLSFFITLSFDFNLIDISFYFSVLNNFRLGNILEVRVLEEVRAGGAGKGQVGYRNSQVVLNPTMYHTWRCGCGNTRDTHKPLS
jgi:hypothetical protein